MGGRDPYSASKGCAELVTAAYRESFFADGAAVASVRAGNVIGGGDWAADRIIPDCVRALAAGEPVVVRNPDAVRPWQHVLEPLSGYLWLAALHAARRPPLRRARGTSGPRTRPATGRCAGWSSASSRSGARVPGPRRPMPGRSPTRPTG